MPRLKMPRGPTVTGTSILCVCPIHITYSHSVWSEPLAIHADSSDRQLKPLPYVDMPLRVPTILHQKSSLLVRLPLHFLISSTALTRIPRVDISGVLLQLLHSLDVEDIPRRKMR